MRLDIVTPERQILSQDVKSVQIPGAEGDMTIMDNHAALVTTLRPGIVSVTGGGDDAEFIVTGGFAEVSAEGASILAERAMKRSEATRDDLESVLEEAKEAAEIATEDAKILARQRINDVSELIKRIG